MLLDNDLMKQGGLKEKILTRPHKASNLASLFRFLSLRWSHTPAFPAFGADSIGSAEACRSKHQVDLEQIDAGEASRLGFGVQAGLWHSY